MSMTQEKMYMNVDDVCAVLGVSKAFAYKIMKGYNEEGKPEEKTETWLSDQGRSKRVGEGFPSAADGFG